MGARYNYLIIGGGMAADAAARGIREIDADGSIGILSADIDPPYARPALSKKLWTEPGFDWAESVDLHTVNDTGADLRLRTEVTKINPVLTTVETRDGDEFGYDVLLIATGGVPTRIDLPDDDRVIYFRSAEDYRRLRAFADAEASVAVVGGGYIGTELAAALIQNGAKVTLIYPDAVLGGSVYPPDLAAHIEGRFRDAGVDLRPNARVMGGSISEESVAGASNTDGSISLELRGGGPAVRVDAVVSGLGITPVTDIAEAAGLDVRDGIVVDTYLATSHRGIFAAGDVANYPDRILGPRRVEHVDNAQSMGRWAGHLMAGDVQPYTHTPSYYSDLFDMGYEAVGRMDSSLELVEDWIEPLEQGVVYYLEDGLPVGVLLWNVWDRTDDARRIIADRVPRENLIGAIR